MEICNYMRCIYPLFYEKIEQYIGSVFLINKLNLSKLFNSFDKEINMVRWCENLHVNDCFCF